MLQKRKNVTWRVSEHPQSELINKWLDEQKNIQDSITNIVLHMIDRFGVRNITDYDIQKMLYQKSSISENNQSRATLEESTIPTGTVSKQIKAKNKPVEETVENTKEINEEDEEDMYSDLDINNL